jgi:hypothetical protein
MPVIVANTCALVRADALAGIHERRPRGCHKTQPRS